MFTNHNTAVVRKYQADVMSAEYARIQTPYTGTGIEGSRRKKVLVTDASQRKSVPIIRSLGRKGIHVIAGDDRPMSMGSFSRYASQKAVYPSPENEDHFISWLIDAGKKKKFDILFPIDERTMEPVTKHLSDLERHMTIPVVDHDTFMIARNKAKTMEYAGKLNIPVPRTFVFNTEEEVLNTLKLMPTPVVIKARKSSGSRGLSYVTDRRQLHGEYRKIHSKYPFPLVQEYIPSGGNTYGVEGLCRHGTVLRMFVHRRIREFPINGGPSTLRESVYKPDIVSHAQKLLKAVNWHGVAMLEFKEDPRTGECVLIEINPKFWGSIALPIAAGVDFPHLLYQLACNEKICEEYSYPEHVLCRWLFPGDLLHFIFNPKRFNLQPSFFSFRNTAYDILDINDPGPVFMLFVSLVRDLFKVRTWNEKIMRH